MSISEAQLDTWSKQGSVAQSRATYETIRKALEDGSAPYAGKDYTIFLQGSYGNDTNIYADSDVDVVMRLNSAFYHDLSNLTEDQKSAFKRAYPDAEYGLTEFKGDVIAQLTRKYGSAVKPGSKAIFVQGNGSRRDADVLIAAKYRRYYSFSSMYNENYAEGICFFGSDGSRIVNFPKQHSDNCTTKHQATSSWFKPVVRIFKNMRNRMVSDNMIEAGLAPSYFLEGMLSNVPNTSFGQSYNSTVANCINWVLQTDRTQLLCANEQYYLLRDGFRVTWTEAKCSKFLSAACNLWNQW
jgi:hypothetical protein